MTKIKDINWLRGWILYDTDCLMCRRFASFIENGSTRRGFDLAPLQSSWVGECLDDTEAARLSSIRIITVDGQAFAGADALLFLAGQFWWGWPLKAVPFMPGAMTLLRLGYSFCAARRCRNFDACRASSH